MHKSGPIPIFKSMGIVAHWLIELYYTSMTKKREFNNNVNAISILPLHNAFVTGSSCSASFKEWNETVCLAHEICLCFLAS